MIRFLLDKDYAPIIRQEIKQVVIGNNNFTQRDAESMSMEEISTYLRGNGYNIPLVFMNIIRHDPETQYNLGEYVSDAKDKIYKALKNEPGLDLENTDDWLAEDPRNKLIVMYMIDFTLYHLHSNRQGNQIPDLRVKRYDDATKMLVKISEGKASMDLPKVEGSESGMYQFNSDRKVTERW